MLIFFCVYYQRESENFKKQKVAKITRKLNIPKKNTTIAKIPERTKQNRRQKYRETKARKTKWTKLSEQKIKRTIIETKIPKKRNKIERKILAFFVTRETAQMRSTCTQTYSNSCHGQFFKFVHRVVFGFGLPSTGFLLEAALYNMPVCHSNLLNCSFY